MNMHVGWAPERVEYLKRHWHEGVTARAIAEALGGVTRNAVVAKVTKLGLPRRAPGLHRPVRRTPSPPPPPAPSRVQPKPKPVVSRPVTVSPEVTGRPVSLWDVRGCQCRWPIGEPSDLESFRFCAAAKAPGSSYCPEHRAKGTSGVVVRTLMPKAMAR